MDLKLMNIRLQKLEELTQQLITWTRMDVNRLTGDNEGEIIKKSNKKKNVSASSSTVSFAVDTSRTSPLSKTPFTRRRQTVAKKSTGGIPRRKANSQNPPTIHIDCENDVDINHFVKLEVSDEDEDVDFMGFGFDSANDDDDESLPQFQQSTSNHIEKDCDKEWQPYEEDNENKSEEKSMGVKGRSKKPSIKWRKYKPLLKITSPLTCSPPFVSMDRLSPSRLTEMGVKIIPRYENRKPGEIARPPPSIACPHCPIKFRYKSHYNQHLIIHTGNHPFKCDLCPFGSNRERNLKQHKIIMHSEINHFQCKFCPESYRSRQRLSTHHNEAHKDEPSLSKTVFTCPQCSHVCYRKKQFEEHLLTHSDRKDFLCPLCGFQTKVESRLKAHINRVHDGKKRKPTARPPASISCPHCPVKLRYRSHYNCHIMTHTGDRPYKCEICGFSTNRERNLKLHKRKHLKDPNDRPFTCEDCGRSFRGKKEATMHKKRFHEGNSTEEYPCPQCNRHFYDKTKLEEHIENRHNLEKKFTCSHCNYRFLSQRDVDVHMKRVNNPWWKRREEEDKQRREVLLGKENNSENEEVENILETGEANENDEQNEAVPYMDVGNFEEQ